MEIDALSAHYRNLIKERIFQILEEKKEDYFKRLDTKIDVFDVLKDFSTKGKMLRGSLFLFCASLYGKEADEELLNVASSLELMHSSLLIHDDIMDNDELRRGEKTIFAKYKEEAKTLNIKDYEHFGISMGIVVGDIALFIAEELATYSNNKTLKKLLQFYTRELRFVGIGQLLDFRYGAEDKDLSYSDIIKMYIDKSARYSFTLPLCLGAISAEVSAEEVSKIEKLGEKIGLIFQIVDDNIGIFGDEAGIGKPVGSDIRENKKTVIRHLLFKKASQKEKKYLEEVFGSESILLKDVEKVRKIIVSLGVKNEVDDIVNKLSDESLEIIEELKVDKSQKEKFIELVNFNKKREY